MNEKLDKIKELILKQNESYEKFKKFGMMNSDNCSRCNRN